MRFIWLCDLSGSFRIAVIVFVAYIAPKVDVSTDEEKPQQQQGDDFKTRKQQCRITRT